MTYAHPYIRLSFGGTQADGNEIWTCGLAVVGTSGDWADPLIWLANLAGNFDEIGQAIQDFVSNSQTRAPADSKLLWAKMAAIGTDGHYVGEPVLQELNSGGGINAAYSPQDAMVVTLVSEVWRGAGRYNRFFIPTVGPAGENDWCLSSAEQGALASIAVTFIEDLNEALQNAEDPTGSLVGCVSNVGSGQQNPVQNVMVGRIVDTQRRRRNQLTENYVTNPVS